MTNYEPKIDHSQSKALGQPPPDAGHPMSAQRPMSDEERAALEAVYQDRGCGVECDPDQ